MQTPSVSSPPATSRDPHIKRKCPSRKLRDQSRSFKFILAKNRAQNNQNEDQIEILLNKNNIQKKENIKLNSNISTLEQAFKIKDNEIELLKKELTNLMEELKEAVHNFTVQLKTQKSVLNEKHKAILKEYTANLKASYEETFNKSVKSYKDEIELLKNKIQIEVSSRLALNSRRPIFSSGRYKPD